MQPRREPPCTRPPEVGVPASVRQESRERLPPNGAEGPIGRTSVGVRAAPFASPASSSPSGVCSAPAARASLDPAAGPVTWDQVIAGAERAAATVEVQGARYEGYTVLISALVASAGGQVLERPEAGRDARPALDSPPGHRAAEVISR